MNVEKDKAVMVTFDAKCEECAQRKASLLHWDTYVPKGRCACLCFVCFKVRKIFFEKHGRILPLKKRKSLKYS